MNWQTVEDQCLRDNKFFAQLVGVWPNQKRFAKFSIRLVTFVVVIVAIVTEVFFSFLSKRDNVHITCATNRAIKYFNIVNVQM